MAYNVSEKDQLIPIIDNITKSSILTPKEIEIWQTAVNKYRHMYFAEWLTTVPETKSDWQALAVANAQEQVGKLLAVRPASLIEFIKANCKAANINNHTSLLDLIKYTKLPVNYGHTLVYMNETLNAHFTRYGNTADIVPVVRALIPDLAATCSTYGHVEPYTPIQFKASY